MYVESHDLLGCTFLDIMVIADLPPLEFFIGEFNYKVWPIFLIGECAQSYLDDGRTAVTCLLKIAPSTEMFILGIPFFNSNYILFNRDDKVIGKRN